MVDARGIIGNYVVERELGRGGMGVVFAARHRVLGRPAAIKLLLASTDDRGRVERFFNEARAAMAIDHAGVVKIFDVGISADDKPYIAMELLDGTSLASLLAHGPLPIRQAIDYASQIASALAAAHDAGVIHRDLKPENIIISRDRARAIVVDFGIAKLAHQATVRTATGALVGTPLYMSPEQCEGTREIDARSDLYAFGCVMFAMVTGFPPFVDGGPGGIIGAHLHVAPPLLRTRCAQASEALERITSVLLAKSPEARFRTARAVLAAVQAPEVRGLAAASGVAATADVVSVAVQPSVQAWSAPMPSPVATTAPVPPPARSHRRTIFAVIASSALTAVIAILAARGCGGATSSDTDAGSGRAVAAITTAPLDAAVATHLDAAVAAAPVDAAVREGRRESTAGKGSAAQRSTKSPPQPKPSPAPVSSTAPSPAPTSAPEPAPVAAPRVELHESIRFGRGDFGMGQGRDVLQRIAAAHAADPSRRIVVTGHAENDEPGVLQTLAGARANAVLTHLTSMRVPRSAIEINSTRFIDPSTPNGANRRVDIDFD